MIGTLTRRHQVAPIALAIAATKSKLVVRFVFSSVKKALYDEFQFEWDLDLLMQDGAFGMFGAAAGLFSTLIVAFCWWHVQPSLRAGLLRCISDKKHRALIYLALNTLHLSSSTIVFCDGWASLNQHWVGYEHYLHHALTEYVEQRNGWYVDLTPPGIPSATLAESHSNKAKLMVDHEVCGLLEF